MTRALLVPVLLGLLATVDVDGAKIPDVRVPANAPGIARSAGVVSYYGAPFSGYLVDADGGRVLLRTPYLAGREHGLAEAYYPNGALRFQKIYRDGHREGVHRGYWPNGRPQFVYTYRDDLFEGEQEAFFANGVREELTHFRAGHEDGPQRFWNEDGRLLANYTFKNGKRYGLVGRFDCMSVR